jgi:two-component system nitrogen regulation sensor histidine kinase NtrY
MDAIKSRRKSESVILACVLLVLAIGFVALNAFNVKAFDSATTGEIVVFTGLSILAFLLLMAGLLLLVRNLLKLYADQRNSVMGTRLRTRMLWGAVLVSIIPLVFMFLFSYVLMNRAVDRWFEKNPDEIRNDSSTLALELAQYTSANARAEAESIAESLPKAETSKPQRALSVPANAEEGRGDDPVSPATRASMDGILQQHEITLQDGFAAVYLAGHLVTSLNFPESPAGHVSIKSWLPDQSSPGDEDTDTTVGRKQGAGSNIVGPVDTAVLAASQRNDLPIVSVGDTDYALGAAGLKQGGIAVVGLPMPNGMYGVVANYKAAADAYWKAYRQRRQVRTLYLLILLMMTAVALFACTWLAWHLSSLVTKPVEALAEATEAIAAGNYAHRVGESATEELGGLVRSFNHMAADLENSRRDAETSNRQFSAANAALQVRRNELETMLETIPNGVATLDTNRNIVLANRALTEILDPGGQIAFLGTPIQAIFPAEALEQIDHLLRRSHRMGSAAGQMEMVVQTTGGGSGTRRDLLVTVALLETGAGVERVHQGYVLVLEDATALLHAQKQAAWKEVARRVAHEIKNPLTPIALSAEQIHRHIDRLDKSLGEAGVQSPSVAVIRRSSEVISSSVESMRALVDQFAALAQFPAVQPRPADLNAIVESSLTMFAGRLQNIRLVKRLAPNLPLILADPEAMKRALGNLIDNAAEAMQQALLCELRVSTNLLSSGMAELTISDTGSGLTDEMRERLFLPYFSTKQRGTGLGLAIAAKIVQEHQGTIRAEKNSPAGARFIVELPVVSTVENDSSEHPIALTSTITLER